MEFKYFFAQKVTVGTVRTVEQKAQAQRSAEARPVMAVDYYINIFLLVNVVCHWMHR